VEEGIISNALQFRPSSWGSQGISQGWEEMAAATQRYRGPRNLVCTAPSASTTLSVSDGTSQNLVREVCIEVCLQVFIVIKQ
jgi:hypothetical protein